MTLKSILVVLVMGLTMNPMAQANEGNLLIIGDESGNSIRFNVGEEMTEAWNCSTKSEGIQQGAVECQSLGILDSMTLQYLIGNGFLTTKSQFIGERSGSALAGAALPVFTMYALNFMTKGSLFAVLNAPGVRDFAFRAALNAVGAQIAVGALGAGAGLYIYERSGRGDKIRDGITRNQMVQFFSERAHSGEPLSLITNDEFFAEFQTMIIGSMSAFAE